MQETLTVNMFVLAVANSVVEVSVAYAQATELWIICVVVECIYRNVVSVI